MSKEMYIGVNGVARRVKEFYVGVNGVARKVKKAYVGVNGVAREFYSPDFWLPSGITVANCIAAYRFSGVASESKARTDLTGHGNTLSKVSSGTVTWTSANGFYLQGSYPYLYTKSLYNMSDVKSIVIAYSGLTQNTATTVFVPFSVLYLPANTATTKPNFYARLYFGYYENGTHKWFNNSGPGVITGYKNNTLTFRYYSKGRLPENGVCGYSSGSSGVIYSKGNALTMVSKTINNVDSLDTTQIGNTNTSGLVCDGIKTYPYYVKAAAFYNVSLTAAQQKAVYQGMNAL